MSAPEGLQEAMVIVKQRAADRKALFYRRWLSRRYWFFTLYVGGLWTGNPQQAIDALHGFFNSYP